MMAENSGNPEKELLDPIVSEPAKTYITGNHSSGQLYINPFKDKFFKKIFASETSREMLKAFLNSVIKGRVIEAITYGKNEYPGEIKSERGAVFDVICTDTDGITFLIEVQQSGQINFIERSIFYAGRFISDQAPRGQPNWNYELKEIYVICLLADFTLPNSKPDSYIHHVTLNYKDTGEQFYDKLEFIYIEIEKFKNFFKLARFSNLTKEERDMYRTEEHVRWDENNRANFAGGRKVGREEERLKALAKEREIAKNLKNKGIDLKIIADATGLSIEEIGAL